MAHLPQVILRRREQQVLRIAEIISVYYGVTTEAARMSQQGRRSTAETKTKQVISYLAHELLGRSYSDIARALKYRDHTPALRGAYLVRRRMSTDLGLVAEIEAIQLQIEKKMEVR